MRVRFADTAKSDIIETLNFYRAPSAMDEVFNFAVSSAIHHFERFPYSGHRRRDLTAKDVCFWTESP